MLQLDHPSTRQLQTFTALQQLMQGDRLAAACNACAQPKTVSMIPQTRSLWRKNSKQPHRHRSRCTQAAVTSPADTTMSVAEGEAAVGEDEDKDEGVIDWRQRWSASPKPPRSLHVEHHTVCILIKLYQPAKFVVMAI
jgi:hypothetical protein